MMAFFASFNTPDLAFMPKLEDVFGLYTKMLLGMGIVFQMPTVVFFLAKMRLVTARFLLEQFKYALPDHLHRGRGHHADRRHDDAGDLRGADGGAVSSQHRHRVGCRTQARRGRHEFVIPDSAVAIKASSSRQIDALVTDLASADAVKREAAIARLTVLGARAVERVAALAASTAAGPARSAAFRTLEGIADPRGVRTGAPGPRGRGSGRRDRRDRRRAAVRPERAGSGGGRPADGCHPGSPPARAGPSGGAAGVAGSRRPRRSRRF